MKSFASFRYYYFYFAWKCEAGILSTLPGMVTEMRSGKLRVDFNLRLTITHKGLHTRSRFINYEVGFFVT